MFLPSSNLALLCIVTQSALLLLAHRTQGQKLDRFSSFDWGLSKAVGSETKGNVVLSPISVKLVLAMLYEGALGNTSRQLEDALGLAKLRRDQSTLQFANILGMLKEESPEYELDIGTKLFIDKETMLNDSYNDTLTRVYNASIQKIDFSKPDQAAKTINKWAATVTKGHIQELISEADAKDSFALLLLNAIYFKGQWLQPFPTDQTVKGKFKINSWQTVEVDFMNCMQSQMYTESYELDASIIRLPYMGDKFAMYIILPNQISGLDSLLDTITPDKLREILKKMEEVQLNISLPKFHFDFTTSLRPALQKLGLYDIFSEKADLSGITKDSVDNLMVSDVIQKAGIFVNEQGSKVYVATEVDLVSKFGEHETSFRVDRPFLFFIEDERTDTVVFVGKVVNPGSAGKPMVEHSHNMKPMITQPVYPGVHYRPEQNPGALNATQTVNTNKLNEQENQSNGSGGTGSWHTGEGALMEHTSNMGESTVPDPPQTSTEDDLTFRHPGNGYFSSNGEFVKQNFDQERNSFFDTELLQQICDSEGQANWVASPASVKTVLGMIYEGASTDTELELSHILRLPKNKTKALRMLHSIQRELHTPVNKDVKWIMANRLLVSAKLPTLPEYNQAMRSMYHASVDLVKFESSTQTANDINRWINNVTQGFIPTLVSPDSLDKDAQMVLLNAVYFKGDWQTPFNKLFSQQECFYPSPDKCTKVNMMNQRSFIKFGLYKPLQAYVFELPYADTRFSMVFVVPKNDVNLANVVRNLPFCPILPFLNELNPIEVQLSLPSFKVEFSKDLTKIITKIGGGSMFSEKADLRNMLGHRRGKISKILHKAKIIVNEKGTEAGAGTAGVIVPLMNTQLEQLTVNQPFLFYVRDQRSGFLFNGRITDPSIK